MNIEISKNAGFCFGVKRAVSIVENLISENKKVYTLGPIIHNPQITENFKKNGVCVIDDINNLDNINKDSTIVIRSHGTDKKTFETLKLKNLNYIDATCPFVKKIHNIVSNEKNKNKILLIAGNENHPEVIGIAGNCCCKYYIFSKLEDLKKLINLKKFEENSEILVIAQTTFDVSEWNKSLNLLKNNYTNLQIFDTICNTTMIRQKEAENLAKKCDIMVVIGGKNSSNTIKLKNICEKHCKTYHIEKTNDLPLDKFKKFHNIGITAGASTPVYIIEEVKNSMENNLNNSEATFEQMLEESLNKMSTDKRVKGIVVKVTPSEVFVDIGRKQSGFIPVSELTEDSNVNPDDIVKVGDELDLLIMKTNDQDGTIMLSKKRVDSSKNWEEVLDSKDKILSWKITDIVKGGLIANYKGIKIFIPASLAKLNRSEALDNLKGQNVEFKIIETDRKRRRVIASIKDVLEEKRKALQEKFWKKAKVGDTIKGVVRSITSYGAFVDVGGIDGLLYIADISWEKIKHPSDVLKVGQEISVIIKDLDREKNKISLGYKDLFESPWDTFIKEYSVGSEANVKIVHLADFGAFAQIIPGLDGLIHISQISNEKINKVSDVLKIGDTVKVKIIEIDPEKHRIGLSIRELLEKNDQ